MSRAFRLVGAAVATAALILTAGCTGDDDGAKSESGAKGGALEKVSYLTGVNIQGRESYVYVAQEKGFFRDAGLDVEVKPGLGSEKNLQLLQAGQVDFAMLDISAGLISFTAMPLDLRLATLRWFCSRLTRRSSSRPATAHSRIAACSAGAMVSNVFLDSSIASGA